LCPARSILYCSNSFRASPFLTDIQTSAMNTRLRLIGILCLTIAVASCQLSRQPTPTPLLGWRLPVSGLFVDEYAFPEGWLVEFPEDTVTDPTVNYVYRSWGCGHISGTVDQQIWRAYTTSEAKDKYTELRDSQFQPSRSLHPSTTFIEFEPPSEISFRSQIADEFYLACGWWDWAYCQVVARYRNYVVLMRLAREAECEGHVTHGLTYPEIETVVRAMDARFEQFFAGLSTPGS